MGVPSPAVVRLRRIRGKEDRLRHAQLQSERGLQLRRQIEERVEAARECGTIALQALPQRGVTGCDEPRWNVTKCK